MSKQWFVFYTKSRQEKKVNALLLQRGFESFLPLQKVMRQWSDRKKKVEVPLFNSYIFVRVGEPAIQQVLQIPGIAWNIRLNGKPAILRPSELETINRFLQTGLVIETSAENNSLSVGDEVRVLDGPLKGLNGVLTDVYNKHQFTMHLSSIGQFLTVHIDGNLVERIF